MLERDGRLGMDGRPLLIPPAHYRLMVLLLILGLAIFLPTFIVGTFTTLLRSVGMDFYSGIMISLAILVFSLLLSPVNIPLFEVERSIHIPTVEFVVVFGIPYPIPRLALSTRNIVVALNVGGALIPLLVSSYLVCKLLVQGLNFLPIIMGVGIVSLFTFSISKTVPGVGIVTPALLPPLVSALTSTILSGGELTSIPLSYISGTLGTLIGGDVLRLWRDWGKLNAPIISIGGAGTFDGIYLTGVFSVALVLFLV